MGMQPFLGSALTQPDQRFNKFDFEDMAEDPFKADLSGGWIAMLQHYFVSAWVPEPDQTYRYRTRQTQSGFNIIGYTGPAVSLAPNETVSITNRLYAGPKTKPFWQSSRPILILLLIMAGCGGLPSRCSGC